MTCMLEQPICSKWQRTGVVRLLHSLLINIASPYSVIRYRKLLLFALSDYPSNYAASLSHCQTLFNFVTFQLQVMPSPRQLFSTCRCRVNMMQPPTSSMLEMLSKRQIHKVGPETLTDVVAGYNQDQKNGVRCCLVLWRSQSSAD